MNVRQFWYPNKTAWDAVATQTSYALVNEIVQVVQDLSTIDIVKTLCKRPQKSEAAKAAKNGVFMFLSPKELNRLLKERLANRGWSPDRLPSSEKSRLEIDFVKGTREDAVMLEVQFGKYAFVAHDLLKFSIWNRIDPRFRVGVELLLDYGGFDNPLSKWCSSGVADFDASTKLLQLYNPLDQEVRVPTLLIGIQPTVDTWTALNEKQAILKSSANEKDVLVE